MVAWYHYLKNVDGWRIRFGIVHSIMCVVHIGSELWVQFAVTITELIWNALFGDTIAVGFGLPIVSRESLQHAKHYETSEVKWLRRCAISLK